MSGFALRLVVGACGPVLYVEWKVCRIRAFVDSVGVVGLAPGITCLPLGVNDLPIFWVFALHGGVEVVAPVDAVFDFCTL